MLGVAKGVGSDGDLLPSPFVLLDGELAKRDDQMADKRFFSHRAHKGHRGFDLNSREGNSDRTHVPLPRDPTLFANRDYQSWSEKAAKVGDRASGGSINADKFLRKLPARLDGRMHAPSLSDEVRIEGTNNDTIVIRMPGV